ncbi:unnamed protein product [Scytosiphon promiscuus]
MAAPLVGERIPHPSRPAGQKGSRLNEVIDLSADSDAAADAAGATSSSAISFRGMKLRDFEIGDRLGQTKDGGEGYQGCNSRVFRVGLRRYQPDTVGRGGNKRNALEDDQRPPTASSRLPRGAADRVAGSGNLSGMSNPGTPRGGCIAADILGVGGQLWRGSFGACFRGDYGGIERAGRQGREDLRRGGETGVETEWALKMALALRGQDPAQARRPWRSRASQAWLQGLAHFTTLREMETEIDVLVRGRIPPHPNIMRGVHSFQDDIGQHLQPTLWAGLGPDVGETLSPRTSFVVMPLFTAGSLQALLNKRRLRCKGPPFLRLLEAMRFLEQMLSAVSHLLAHGVAHNDIKPDNWLLRADQRTLVLTDFGACVDSRKPPQARSPCLPPPAPPTRCSGAAEAAAAAVANGGGRAAGLVHRSSPPGSTAAAPAAASASAAAASGYCRPQGTGVPPATPAPAASTPCRPREVPRAAPASAEAAAAAQAAGLTRGDRPSGPGEFLPPWSPRPRLAGDSSSDSGAARSSAGAAAAAAAARASTREKRPRADDRSLPASARSRLTGESTPECGGNDGKHRGRKRARCYGGQGGDGGQARCGLAGPEYDGSKTPKNSEKLVLPFSKYYVTGAPSVVAPELAQAWRGKKTVLDFRRSDVFSVGVCMYRMLRPDSGDIDNETGLEGKGPLEKIEGRFGQQAWPLPLFPENKGGCPYEVSQLCRGLLQADPAQRQDASEGLSLASWFVSRLEGADKAVGKDLPAPSESGAGLHRGTGPATAGGGTGGGKGKGDESPCRSPSAGAHEHRASVGGPERHGVAVSRGDGHGTLRRERPSATPTDGVFPPWWQDLMATPVGRQHEPLRQGSGQAPVDGNHKAPPAGASPSQSARAAWTKVEHDRSSMLPSEAPGDWGVRERDGKERAASGGAAAAGVSISEEERRLGEPDELVRSDRISHMRDFFASAAPEDLFKALDAKGWDVAAACANFDDVDVANKGDRGGERGTSVKGDLTPASRVTLFFEGVAEELKGRRREVLSPPCHRQPLTGGSLQVPPPPFGR